MMEREGPEHLVGKKSSDLQALQLAKNKRHDNIAATRVKDDPLRAQSLCFPLIVGTDSVKKARFS